MLALSLWAFEGITASGGAFATIAGVTSGFVAGGIMTGTLDGTKKVL